MESYVCIEVRRSGIRDISDSESIYDALTSRGIKASPGSLVFHQERATGYLTRCVEDYSENLPKNYDKEVAIFFIEVEVNHRAYSSSFRVSDKIPRCILIENVEIFSITENRN